jgi:hypothetical protein
MKILKSVLFTLLFLLVFPVGSFARELVREENGNKCIDLEAVYADVNDSSKAFTGQDNSVDAIKKANTIASLTNILSILVGDRIYCVKDEVAASRVGGFEQLGLIGQLEYANSNMLAYFPTVDVGGHLAESFIPGYKDNVGIYGIGSDEVQDALEKTGYEGDVSEKNEGWFIGELKKKFNEAMGKELNKIIGDSEIDEEDENGTPVTSSGYNYLKENLKLDVIWGQFRNVAYLFYVVVLVVVGFMIMFRKNLPGQVVVSLGNTIPHIVLGLVLVTFSFAIVGIVMDLGKVSMNVIGNMFVSAYSTTDSSASKGDLVAVESVGSLTNQALKKAKKDGLIVKGISKIPIVGETLANVITGTGGTTTAIVGQSLMLYKLSEGTKAVQGVDGNIDTGLPGVEAGVDIGLKAVEIGTDITLASIVRVGIATLLIRNIILLLVCLYASFRLFVTMLMTYLKLFMNVVFAPIQIMLGSLPGNFNMTVNWFKSVVANVLVFVGIYLVVNLFAYLSQAVDPSQFNFFGNKGVFWPDWIVSLEGVILIGGYLFAANMPAIINGALQVGPSKEMSAVGQSVQKAASKMPIIGSMFGS